MKRLACMVWCLLGTASAVQAADDWSTWRINPNPFDEAQVGSDTRIRYLFREDGRDRVTTIGSKLDPRFEVINIDLDQRIIRLVTSSYEVPQSPPKAGESRRCRGKLGPEQRKGHYSICNSRFAIRVGDGVSVDVERMQRVLNDANVMGVIADERLKQYRADFANARSERALIDFAKRYQDADPDGLVEQARSKQSAQRLVDYRLAFKAAMESPTYARTLNLQRFIDRHRDHDPEQLIRQANDELSRLAAQERLQQQQIGEMGATVCYITMGYISARGAVRGPLGQPDTGYIKLIGFTEQATPSKLKIQVNRIVYTPFTNPAKDVPLDTFAFGDIDVATGKPGWFDRTGWKLCKSVF
jgi:hypothetical protein